MNFLRLYDRDLNINDDEVKPSGRGYGPAKTKENLGFLFDDDYLKIKLYMVENEKPKNKYDLIALGRCRFDEDLLKLPRNSFYSFDIPWGNLQTVVREFASVADLKTWLGTHRDKILTDEIHEYLDVKADYLAALKEYTIDDFTELLRSRCPKCGYFTSVLDTYQPDKCPRDETPMEKL
jgi:hypothetical protein